MFLMIFFFLKLLIGNVRVVADIWLADLLQEAGDVIPTAGGPDERICLHGDVVSHQLGGLLAAGPTGVPHTVMIHPKPKAHDDTVTTLWGHVDG